MNDRLDDTMSILDALIAHPTVSPGPNRSVIDDIAGRLENVGARVRLVTDESGAKANLFATLGPEGDGGIVLSGHSDVVPAEESGWTSDPFTMRAEDGKLYGRGTCDMKGFIAAVLATAPLYATGTLRRPVHFAFTYDEEVGCLGARHLVEVLGRDGPRPSMAIVGEPTSMRIIEGHKGCCEYSTSFHGLEGHGSQPDLGVSAVEYAARFVGRLLEMRAELTDAAPAGSRFDPPWTTLQVGRMEGGVAHNVIAGLARVDWELRPVRERDREHVVRTMREYCNDVLLPAMRSVHPGAAIETEVIGEVAGLEPVDDNEARRIVQELTGGNSADLVSFGTEAGLFQSLGMSVVVCGPGSIEQAHKANEFVALDQLSACLDMLERLDAHLR